MNIHRILPLGFVSLIFALPVYASDMEKIDQSLSLSQEVRAEKPASPTYIPTTTPTTIPIPSKNRPLLIKKKFPGFTPVEYANSETCSLYSNRVVIKRSFGAGALKGKERVSHWVSRDIYQLLVESYNEGLNEEPNYLCDAPSSETHGLLHGKRKFILHSTGGCGSPKLERVGPASTVLRNMINTFCP